MASLLDLNLDEILGTKNPVQGLITDPNYATKLDIDTALGLGQGYYNSLYKGYSTPRKILNAVLGAKAGRQSGIDTFTKNYMTQQDILKDTLAIQKSKGDIDLQALEKILKAQNIEKNPYEKEKLIQDIGIGKIDERSKQLSLIKQETEMDGYEKYLNSLPHNKQIEFAALGAKDFFANNPLTNEERLAYQTFGIKDRFRMTDEQADLMSQFYQYIPEKDAISLRYEQSKYSQSEGARYQRTPIVSQLDFLNQYIAKKEVKQTGSQPTKQTVSKNSPQRQYGITYNENNEKIYNSYDGTQFTETQWNALGRREQDLHNPFNNQAQYDKTYDAISKDKVADSKIINYGMEQSTRTARNIEKILSNPKALDALFTPEGRLKVKVNEMTGGWFAELGGEAQDIANLIETLKSKQFTDGIQRMRLNNPTGGAVGNVSDKEVAMFQSMEEFLGLTGTREAFYTALVDLYGKSKEVQNSYANMYINDYGEEAYNKTNLKNAKHTFKDYPATLGTLLNKVPEGSQDYNIQPDTEERLKKYL